MHVRGKDFNYTLVYPDGTSKLLLSVPKWDFNWQLTYVFKEEVPAPKGSKLICRGPLRQLAQEQVQPRPDERPFDGGADLGGDDDRLSRLHARQTGSAQGAATGRKFQRPISRSRPHTTHEGREERNPSVLRVAVDDHLRRTSMKRLFISLLVTLTAAAAV